MKTSYRVLVWIQTDYDSRDTASSVGSVEIFAASYRDAAKKVVAEKLIAKMANWGSITVIAAKSKRTKNFEFFDIYKEV